MTPTAWNLLLRGRLPLLCAVCLVSSSSLSAVQQAVQPRALRPSAATQSEFRDQARLAIVVGIASYPESSQLPSLKYTARDAQVVADALSKSGYKVRTLLNEQAGTQAVREALAAMKNQVRSDATVIFYFAGHGMTVQDKLYLATHGTTASSLGTSGLSQGEVDKLLQDSGAKRRIMWIDACRNMATPGSRSLPLLRTAVRFAISRGTRVLYAAAGDKESFEADELQHGVFTYFLVEGLKGQAAQADGFITFDDLASYVTMQVMDWGFTKGRQQEPHVDGEHLGDFLVAVNGPPSSPSSPPPSPSFSPPPPRRDLTPGGATPPVPATSRPDSTLVADVRRMHEDEQWAESLPVLNRLLSAQPNSPELLALRTHAYSHLNRQADALADGERAVKEGPQNAEAYLRRGEALLGADNRLAEALADFNRSIKLNPKEAEAWGNHGFALAAQGQHKQAVESFTQGLAIRKDRYDLWFGRGVSRFQLGERDKALADLSEAVALRPREHALYRERANVYLVLRQYDAALKDANQALKLDPDDPYSLVMRGAIYSAVGNVQKAIEDLRYALRLRPDLKDAADALRTLESQAGHSPSGPADSGRAATAAPESLSYARLQDNVSAAMRTQRWAEAGQLVDQMIQLDPSRSEGWSLRGVLAMTAYDNLPVAYEAFENALSRGGDAAFRVAHDHGSDQMPCFGVIGVTTAGISFSGDTGGHQFRISFSSIREAAINQLYGSAFGMFHIKTVPGDGNRTFNFAVVRATDATIINRRPDAEMLLGLINRRRQ
jgi:regulator of sirC expression with transglutaminase-like and TPR domain